MRAHGIIVCCLVVAAGCTCSHEPVDTGAAEAAIREADLALARAVADCDMEAFKALVADDAVFYDATDTLDGVDEVAAGWAPLLDPERTTTLTWEPHTVRTSSNGELGYSRGAYVVTSTNEDGSTRSGSGEYVTIWRQNAEGRWQVELDIGTPPQAQDDTAAEDDAETATG